MFTTLFSQNYLYSGTDIRVKYSFYKLSNLSWCSQKRHIINTGKYQQLFMYFIKYQTVTVRLQKNNVPVRFPTLFLIHKLSLKSKQNDRIII